MQRLRQRMLKIFMQGQRLHSTTLSTQVWPMWLVVNLYEKVHSVYKSMVIDNVGGKRYNAVNARWIASIVLRQR